MAYNLRPMRRVITQTDPKTGDSHILIDETVEAKKWDREDDGVRNLVRSFDRYRLLLARNRSKC